MSDPDWLFDEDEVQSRPKSNVVPKGSPGAYQNTVQKRNAELDANGLDFLKQEEEPTGWGRADGVKSSGKGPTDGTINVIVKETKKGALIVPEPSEMGAGSPGGKTNAPVHFIRRMQEAEKKRSERLEKTVQQSSIETPTSSPSKVFPKPTPPPQPKKPSDAKDPPVGLLSPRHLANVGSTTSANNSSVAVIGADGGIIASDVDLSVVPPLSQADKQTLGVLIDEFGELCVRKLKSSRYQHRVEALCIMKDETLQRKYDAENAALEAIDENDTRGVETLPPSPNSATQPSQVLQLIEGCRIGLTDSLFHVIVAACSAIDTLIDTFSVLEGTLHPPLYALASQLSQKLRDSNVKTRNAVTTTLQRMAAHPSIGPAPIVRILSAASEGSNNSVASPREDWKLTATRLDLVQGILRNTPAGTVEELSEGVLVMASSGLESADPRARKQAASLFAAVFDILGGKNFSKYLTNVNPSAIKMLKSELGIDENASFSSVDKLAATMSFSENMAAREEDEDLQSFETEKDTIDIGSEQEELLENLRQSFPNIRSFSVLFSSRWVLRERVIKRLATFVEDEISSVSLAIAKLESTNSDMNSSQTKTAGGKEPSRFQEDEDDEEELSSTQFRRKQLLSPRGGQGNTTIVSPRPPPDDATPKDISCAAPPIFSRGQLESMIAVAVKGLSDSVPAVSVTALSLLSNILPTLRGGFPRSTRGSRAATPPPSENADELTTQNQNSENAEKLALVFLMLIPDLVNLSTSTGTGAAAKNALVDLAVNPNIGLHRVCKEIVLLEPLETTTRASTKSACSRLDCCAHVISLVTNDRNIDLQLLLGFSSLAFQHGQVAVRNMAANLVVELYKRVGDQIYTCLKHLKPAVLIDLKARMAKISKRDKILSGGVVKQRLNVLQNENVLNIAPPTTGSASPARSGVKRQYLASQATAVAPPTGVPDLLPGVSSICSKPQGGLRKGNLILKN